VEKTSENKIWREIQICQQKTQKGTLVQIWHFTSPYRPRL